MDHEVIMEEWDAVAGPSEMQDIPGLEGLEGASLGIYGAMDVGEYLAILEVRERARRCFLRPLRLRRCDRQRHTAASLWVLGALFVVGAFALVVPPGTVGPPFFSSSSVL